MLCVKNIICLLHSNSKIRDNSKIAQKLRNFIKSLKFEHISPDFNKRIYHEFSSVQVFGT